MPSVQVVPLLLFQGLPWLTFLHASQIFYKCLSWYQKLQVDQQLLPTNGKYDQVTSC